MTMHLPSALRSKTRAAFGTAIACSLAFGVFLPTSNATFNATTSNEANSISAKIRTRLVLSGTWSATVNSSSPGVKMGTVAVVDGTEPYTYTITKAVVSGSAINFTLDETTINGRAYSRARYAEFSIVIDKASGEVFASRSTGTARGSADVTLRGVDSAGFNATATQRVTGQ